MFILKSFNRIQGKQKGPGYFLKELSVNQDDIFLLESIHQIPTAYFFSIVEAGRLYSFDIRHFEKLNGVNPYTQLPFNDRHLSSIEKRLKHLEQRGYVVYFPKSTQRVSRKDQIRRNQDIIY